MLNQRKKTKNIFRIAHYNIFNGGSDRLENIGKVLSEINPDICGILEADGWYENQKQYKDFMTTLGYDFFKVVKANTRHHFAVISKTPIRIKTIRKGVRHVILHVLANSTSGKELDIFFVHLNPMNELDRLAEIEIVSRLLKKTKHAVLMGDFNSLSFNDTYDEKKLLRIFKKQKIEKYGVDQICFNVVKKIEKLHLIDVATYLRKPFMSTTPTLMNKDPAHATSLRIDYVFVSKSLIPFVKGFCVLKNKRTEMASDHYPVFFDIKK